MLNGLSLFSGIGGIDLALAPWVQPIAYCENDTYAQCVLLSRMAETRLRLAPIWDDVRTLRGDFLPSVDIVYGGFPCQDISVAGAGRGLEGERSGLFFEFLRIVEETQPAFAFVENVPAIQSRGLSRICFEMARLGFDLRWTTLSAEAVGAPHLRRRFFLLAAHTNRIALRLKPEWGSGRRAQAICAEGQGVALDDGENGNVANAESARRSEARIRSTRPQWGPDPAGGGPQFSSGWWAIEPDVGRVAHGVPARVDRIRGLGNAVVPLQAREAFKKLMGLLGNEFPALGDQI